MTARVGISGAVRHACAAVCVGGTVQAVCEQERLTRVRGVGLTPPYVPVEALDQVLQLADRRRADVTSYVVAERQVRLPAALPTLTLDHHRAHAATAYFTSPFDRAAVLVCDRDPGRELSVWVGEASRLRDTAWPWRGPAYASLYSTCASLLGCSGPAAASRLEAMAHLGRGDGVEPLRQLIDQGDGMLRMTPGALAAIERAARDEAVRPPIQTASAVQRRIVELVLSLAAEMQAATGLDRLCLGGGLFHNTCITTALRTSGIFSDVFVPINPGNAGLALGATLMLAREESELPAAPGVSPFLGPEYDEAAIKDTLDGCKLSYAFVRETEALDQTVDALARGALVGWFDGRMEWGPRALGHRCILASPHSRYVLDNLNVYLRKRERWRAFGISVQSEAAPGLLRDAAPSPFMQFEFEPRDERMRHVMPVGASSIRVQTVSRDLGRFWELHRRVGQATGTPALVNTSLNGFHEPIACTPRDAVRVFYGTGLDMLVMGRFILRK